MEEIGVADLILIRVLHIVYILHAEVPALLECELVVRGHREVDIALHNASGWSVSQVVQWADKL